MKQFVYIILIKIFFLGIFNISEAQTLDYTNVNYPTSLCNVFNVSPARVVGGLTHYPVSGGVSYNGSALVLQTKGGQTLSTTLGTAYAIAIPIKQGFIYNITVNASKQSQDPVSAPLLEVGAIGTLADPNTTNPTACGAVDQNKWTVVQAATIGLTYVSTTTFQNYPVVQNYTPNNNLSYLTILAHSGSQTYSSTVLINSITITETAAVSFTLTPASLNIQCGNTIPQTFTVANVNNTPNVTNYSWNLGANNGWLYNGNPAPQTISTGTTNILTLTPICGASQKNLSVMVTAGGNNYNTNTSTVTITLPTLSISGNSTLCSGTSDYTLNNNNLPCNSTVAWTSSKTNIATVTPTGNPGTVTRVSNGDVKITATVTACGTILPPISKTIIVGVPQYTYEIVPSPISSYTECYKLNKTYSFTIQPLGTDPYYPNGPYQWYCTGIGILGSTTKTVSLQFTQPGDYTLSVRPNSPCGLGPVSEYSETLHASSSCSDGGYYLVSPNPMKGNLKITTLAKNAIDKSSVEKKIEEVGFDRIEIIDKTGNVVFNKSFPKNTSNANMNISSLHSDIYVVRIFNGSTSEVHKIMIQK